MHFWIDKRSQQCGFGRSRVAASLSGAGGSSGLSYGHPPRRMGGSKTTHSAGSSQASLSALRQQQQHQQHQQQLHQQHQQQQQHQHHLQQLHQQHLLQQQQQQAHHCHQQQQPRGSVAPAADCHVGRGHHYGSNDTNCNLCQQLQLHHQQQQQQQLAQLHHQLQQQQAAQQSLQPQLSAHESQQRQLPAQHRQLPQLQLEAPKQDPEQTHNQQQPLPQQILEQPQLQVQEPQAADQELQPAEEPIKPIDQQPQSAEPIEQQPPQLQAPAAQHPLEVQPRVHRQAIQQQAQQPQPQPSEQSAQTLQSRNILCSSNNSSATAAILQYANNNAHQYQQQLQQLQHELQQRQAQQLLQQHLQHHQQQLRQQQLQTVTQHPLQSPQLPPSEQQQQPAQATQAAPTSSVAVLTDAGTVVPVTTHSMGGRAARHNHRLATVQQQSQQYPATITTTQVSSSSVRVSATIEPSNPYYHQYYDTRNYHHPQFGNMAVRHCAAALQHGTHTARVHQQPQQQQQPTIPLQHQQSLSSIGSSASQCRAGQPVGAAIEQQVYRSPQVLQHGYGHDDGAVPAQYQQSRQSMVCTPQRSNSSGAMRSNAVGYGTTASHGHSNTDNNHHQQRQQRNAIIVNTGLPTYLKWGMMSSFVLASVFISGVKVYFDHQNLEVLIFCAFSATFFLAACTVSLCRLPKGLLPVRLTTTTTTTAASNAAATGVSSAQLDEHSRAALYATMSNASGSGGSGDGGSGLFDSMSMSNEQQQRYLELQERSARTAAAQAGPPPYHIAILLPENSKEVPLDESPPPSYDKILLA